MKNCVRFEWVVETLQPFRLDDGTVDADIIDCNHWDSYLDALFWAKHNEDKPTRIGLVRDRYSESEGVLDRQWAYVTNGHLPNYFEDASGNLALRVPPRFWKEVEAQHEPGTKLLAKQLPRIF